MKLSDSEVQELVDLLRTNLLYQSPTYATVRASDGATIELAQVLIHADAYVDVMRLIGEHGGWDMTPEEKARHYEEEKAEIRQAARSGRLDALSVAQLMMTAEAAERENESEIAAACRREMRRRQDVLSSRCN